MNLKRIRNSISAIALAVMMAMPGVPVHATTLTYGEETTKVTDTNTNGVAADAVQLTIVCDKKIKLSGTSNYSVTQENKWWDGSGIEANVDTAAVTISPISVNQNAGKGSKVSDAEDYRIGTFKGGIDVSQITLPGVYTYILKEGNQNVTGTNSGDRGASTTSWINDLTEYRLRVYAENVVGEDGTTTLVKTITLEKIKDRYGNTLTTTEKVDAATFCNYVQGNIAVNKVVVDPSSVKSDDTTYTFYLQAGVFDSLKNYVELPNPITYDVISTDGITVVRSGNLKMSQTHGNDAGLFDTVSITKGQTIQFTNLPEGCYLTAIEDVDDSDDNRPTVVSVEKRSFSTNDQKGAEEKKNVEVSVDTLLEFTNTYKEKIIITGVVTDIAPYITIVVIAIAAIAAYILVRRKMR